MRRIRPIHLALVVLLVAGLVVQVFLAGMGVFDGAANFATHATWGYLLELLPLLMLVLAALGRLGRRQIVYAVAIFLMFMLQSVFVAVRGDLPMIAALHAVNGFGILLLGIVAAREAWADRRRPEADPRDTREPPVAIDEGSGA